MRAVTAVSEGGGVSAEMDDADWLRPLFER